MQKNKKNLVKTIKGGTNVQARYHGGNYSGQSYAFEGYTRNLYFTSDRKEELTTVNDNLVRSNGQAPKGFGVEFELSCDTITDDNVLSLFIRNVVIQSTLDTELVKFQRDGSLSGRSTTEMITQVMTKEFIRNHYSGFKGMWDAFKRFGIGTNSSCGQHVNISKAYFGGSDKAQDDATRKLYYIINNHYDMMVKFLHRNPTCTTYCNQTSYNAKNDNDWRYILGNESHHNCLNYSHYNAGRIEIRLVGGHNDFLSWRNTMECVFFLCDRAKTISWKDCDNFAEIFKGCNIHVYKRLSSECTRYIDTETLEKIKQNLSEENYFLASENR